MKERGASARVTARVTAVALAAAGAVTALGGTAAADPDVYNVSTAQELKDALEAAHLCTDPVVIQVSGIINLPDSYAEDDLSAYVGTPQINCDQGVAIIGATADAALVRTGNEEYGVLIQNNSTGVLQISGLRIEGFSPEERGAIASYGDIMIDDSSFIDNYNAYSAGGAVWSQGGVQVGDTLFSGNVSENAGGAIFAVAGLSLFGVTATENQGFYAGAFQTLGQAFIEDSVFSSNHSTDGSGGAVSMAGGSIVESSFTGNTALGGGAVWSNAPLDIELSVFDSNEATFGYGGAVRNTSDTIVVDSEFSSNTSTHRGGAVYSADSIMVEDSVFTSNASQHGGALSNDHSGEGVTVVGSAFESNVADPESTGQGGAIWAPGGPLSVTQSSFVSNEAYYGGAIYAQESMDLSHSTLYGNSSDYLGGAAYVVGGGTVLYVTAVANQQLTNGALHMVNGDVTIAATVVAGSASSISPRECSATNSAIISGGYNAFGALGCVDELDATDSVRSIDDDFGLNEIEEAAVGYQLPPVQGGPLEDAIPVDDPVCASQTTDQNSDVRPQGRGCDIGAIELFSDLEPYYVATEAPFSDVSLEHPFVDEIAWLATTGVTTGYDDGTFRPSGAVTRQAMAAFLMRFVEVEDFEAPATATFTDVPTTHPFFEQIEWLVDAGIATGYSDGTFRGSAPVSRQAMAAFLFRLMVGGEPVEPETATFTDVPTTHPFFGEIEWLVDAGITTGYDDGTFRGSATVTRQATAAFLYRLYFDYRP